MNLTTGEDIQVTQLTLWEWLILRCQVTNLQWPRLTKGVNTLNYLGIVIWATTKEE